MNIENLSTGSDPNLTLVILVDSDSSEQLVRSSLDVLNGYTVWLARCDCSVQTVMFEQAEKLLTELDRTGFKRSSIIAFNRATAVAQIALGRNAQIVRRAVFINPETREEPTGFERFLERWQSGWRWPLPFKLDRERFDIRYLQHRVACPLLIVKTSQASAISAEACESLSERAPSSWLMEIHSVQTTDTVPKLDARFVEVIREFIEVPAKRSQKNTGAKKSEKQDSPAPDETVKKAA